jgi:hypothetical protein
VSEIERLLTPALGRWLGNAPEPAGYRNPTELDELLNEWAAGGARIVELGRSREGRAIRAAVIGDGHRTLLAWGHPHPDEPLGACALAWLAEGALAGELPDLAGWRMVLVPCADPDQTARQLWFAGPRTAENFVRGAWRPTNIGLEVDYGFPIDWGPFYQPPDYQGRCHTMLECRQRCGPDGCRRAERPYGPLPESLALAEAVKRFHPEIVASMHSTHTGGDYTFLRLAEAPEVLDDLLALPAACGSLRHLGEAIDPGARWRRGEPDLLRERDLEYHRRALERRSGYDPGLCYAGNASIASYLEAFDERIQMVCPEATQFRHPDFADRSSLDEQIEVDLTSGPGRAGRYYRRALLPAGGLILAQERLDQATRVKSRRRSVDLSRGMLGVLALDRRRRVIAEAERIWSRVASLEELVEHPYLDERRAISTAGADSGDRSMLIFRSRADYRRRPTRAQAASFRWLWPLHTASQLGNFQNFLAVQDTERPEIAAARRELNALQDSELAELPAALREEAPRGPALRSMLARVFRLCLARA